MKFGGTSVGSAARMKSVLELVQTESRKKVVVLSAMSGTTNVLVEYAQHLYHGRKQEARNLINELELKYYNEVNDLFSTEQVQEQGKELVRSHFQYLRSFSNSMFQSHEEKAVLAQGEMLSTTMMYMHAKEIGVPVHLASALDFMMINEDAEPDMPYISEKIAPIIKEHQNEIIITQGFICRNIHGEIDNLKRGGSDYTASLIGAAIQAEEVQIWTDIDGMHNNDPRVVDRTRPIQRLTFDEAAELAYFGAKILHPTSVVPAKKANVPVKLLNTMEPQALGTTISTETQGEGVFKAVAAKDGITAVKIRSGRMLMAYGFLRKVFEIFERYKTSIDLITTSEVAISVSIDDLTYLEDIKKELGQFAEVEVDTNQSIVSLVGHNVGLSTGVAQQVFKALENISVRMISFGGSMHNVSILVATEDKVPALKAINQEIFKL